MSTRTKTVSSSSWAYKNNNGSTAGGKCPKAKCAANQTALERLHEVRISAMANPMSRYGQTVKKAMDSLAKCTTPITTRKEACELKGVGPAIAKIIVKTADAPPSTLSRSNSIASTSSTATSTTSRKRKGTGTAVTAADLKPQHSAKQKAYDKAVQEANELQLPIGDWKVILLIDNREHRGQHVQAKCQMSGLPCEQRTLPIGDMAWIARSGSIEIMLGTIIERKDVNDLASSLFGTRYLEQRLRLQHSGLDQLLLLVEGNIHSVRNCPAKTLQYAMMETRVHLGFQVVQTQHLDDTVRFLKRIHRRLLQRSFPDTFSDSADVSVPSFASPEQQRDHRRGRRRGKKKESLQEMILDDGPPRHPVPGKRFMTYIELKTKIERDREAGTRTVGNVYQAMLKQIPTLSHRKVMAVGQAYPTYQSLLQAYQDLPTEDGLSLVQDLSTNDGAERTCRIGPKSAAELYHVCTQGSTMSHGQISNEKYEDNDNALGINVNTEKIQVKNKEKVATVVAEEPSILSAKVGDFRNHVDNMHQDLDDTRQRSNIHIGQKRNPHLSSSTINSGGDDTDEDERICTITSKNASRSILLEEEEDQQGDSFNRDKKENRIDSKPSSVVPRRAKTANNINRSAYCCVDLTEDDDGDDHSSGLDYDMKSGDLRMQDRITKTSIAASGTQTLPSNHLNALDDRKIQVKNILSPTTRNTASVTTSTASNTGKPMNSSIPGETSQPLSSVSIASAAKPSSSETIRKKRKLVTLEMASWDDDSSSNDDEAEPLIVRIQKQLSNPIPDVNHAGQSHTKPRHHHHHEQSSTIKKYTADSCNMENKMCSQLKPSLESLSSNLVGNKGHDSDGDAHSSGLDIALATLNGTPRGKYDGIISSSNLKYNHMEMADESSSSGDDFEDRPSSFYKTPASSTQLLSAVVDRKTSSTPPTIRGSNSSNNNDLGVQLSSRPFDSVKHRSFGTSSQKTIEIIEIE